MVSLEVVIFYLLLVDSISINIIAWFFPSWYKKNTKNWYKYFPPSKGWAIWYLVLVLWIGYLLNQLEFLF